jgi:hypothetical protein
VQNAVDFVTIHILPYWEDFPIPAASAAAHVTSIRRKVAAAFPGKEIVIGEFGWPSAGRMREGARPSPSNQARAIEETLALAKRENFRLNVIEAFDQPWKRWLEGAVGGYWGIFDRSPAGPRFKSGGVVSDHPHWPIDAIAGILLAAAMFAGAWMAGRGKSAPRLLWPRIAALAVLPAILLGWTIEAVPVDSFSVGGWLRSLAFAATAVIAPIACACGRAAGAALPTFGSLLGRSEEKGGALRNVLGASFVVLTLLSVQAALGLVFDPRYRDIPFAQLSAAAAPFLLLTLSTPRMAGSWAVAELIAAAVLAASAVYIAINETFANWQAMWFCAGLIGIAVTLLRARDAPD